MADLWVKVTGISSSQNPNNIVVSYSAMSEGNYLENMIEVSRNASALTCNSQVAADARTQMETQHEVEFGPLDVARLAGFAVLSL